MLEFLYSCNSNTLLIFIIVYNILMYPVLTGCIYLRELENIVFIYDRFVWLDRCMIERFLLNVHTVHNTETPTITLFDSINFLQ